MTRGSKDGDPGAGFLARWSRRKQGAREGRGEADDRLRDVTALPPAAAGAPVEEVDESTLSDEDLLVRYELPDPETLTASDDVVTFMRKGVPARLRSLALRRLWRLDPVLANLDGLNDYDEDYTDAAMLAGTVKTLYQVGKGGAAHLREAADKLADAGERAPDDLDVPESAVPAPAIGKHEAAGGEAHEDVIGGQGGEGASPPFGHPSTSREAGPPAPAPAPEPQRRRRMVFAAPDEPDLNTGSRHFNK